MGPLALALPDLQHRRPRAGPAGGALRQLRGPAADGARQSLTSRFSGRTAPGCSSTSPCATACWDERALAAAAKRDGAANAKAEADKHRHYPAGRAPWGMLPLALETCGRHGRAVLRHLRELARGEAALLGEEAAPAAASALASRWGRELSVALRRATARQLRSALGADGAGRAAVLRAAEAAWLR